MLLAAHGMPFIERNWTFFPFSATECWTGSEFHYNTQSQRSIVVAVVLLLFVAVVDCLHLVLYYRPLNMREVEHNRNTNPSQQARTWFSRRHNSFYHSHRSHVVILFRICIRCVFLFYSRTFCCCFFVLLFNPSLLCKDFSVIDVFDVRKKNCSCEFWSRSVKFRTNFVI